MCLPSQGPGDGVFSSELLPEGQKLSGSQQCSSGERARWLEVDGDMTPTSGNVSVVDDPTSLKMKAAK